VFYHTSDPESDEHEHCCSGKQDGIPFDIEVPKPVNEQNGAQTGGEIDTFLKRAAGIAVDVRQHTSHAAQSRRKQTHRCRKAELVGNRSKTNTRYGAASKVLIKTSHRGLPYQGLE